MGIIDGGLPSSSSIDTYLLVVVHRGDPYPGYILLRTTRSRSSTGRSSHLGGVDIPWMGTPQDIIMMVLCRYIAIITLSLEG